MGSHTPGPWAVTKAKPRTVTSGGVLICNAALRNLGTVKQNKHGKDEIEAEANARLIAAGPELLEALQALISACEFEANSLAGGDFSDLIGPPAYAAYAAIAKATGQ